MGADARKSPRSRVHLRVAYKHGDSHVERFAHNLSAGGLFVPDAEGLEPRDQVQIEIELPRHGVFRVNAEVMHVSAGRLAGAGLQLKSPPAVFKNELEAYLKQLERRASAQVFVDEDPWRGLLAEAGYRVTALPPPHAVVALLGDPSVLALVANVAIAEQYLNALAFLGHDSSLVIAIDDGLPVEPVLAQLDDRLLGTPSVTAS